MHLRNAPSRRFGLMVLRYDADFIGTLENQPRKLTQC